MTCECQRHELIGGSGGMPHGKMLKSGPFREHFQHSGEKIVFEQKTDSIKFWNFGGNFQRKVSVK